MCRPSNAENNQLRGARLLLAVSCVGKSIAISKHHGRTPILPSAPFPYPRRSSRRSARTISSTPIARSPPAPAGWTASGFKAKKNSRRAPAAPASVWTDPEVGVRIRHGEFIRRNCSLVVCFALSALPQRGHSDLAFIGAVEGEQVGRYDRRKQRNIDRQVNVIFRR